MQKLFPGDLIAAVRDHFVDIHIGLSAAAGLPDSKRELAAEPAVHNLLADLTDQAAALLVKLSESAVGHSGRFLQDGKSPDDLYGHFFRPDLKVLVASLRLCAPVAVRGHSHLSHGVMFDPVFHLSSFLSSLVCCIESGAVAPAHRSYVSRFADPQVNTSSAGGRLVVGAYFAVV